MAVLARNGSVSTCEATIVLVGAFTNRAASTIFRLILQQ
jgi:hypothetical protein